jgi:phytoene dehydrogenase-like protein
LTELSYPLGNTLRLSSPEGVTEDEYAHVMEPYRKGSWRLPSGDLLVRKLISGINGTIRTGCEVTAIEPGRVHCADGSTYEGIIISDIHPRLTFALFQGHVRPAYLHRLQGLEDGPGIFTVYCKLCPETIEYQPWSTNFDGNLMIQYGNPDGKGFARSADLLAFSGKVVPDRAALAESVIRRVPGLAPAVEKYWTSTPATWERYTGTPGGTAFGIRKKDATCFVHPRTPVPGLYLTGQNCGLHGVLGVSETALVTCQEILGEQTLKQIMQS